jgi:DNA-binding MarR family transcriptional regulator
VKSSSVDAARLDLGYLAFFLGLRINQLVLERLRAAGFARARESHGYVIQHLVDAERTITELADRMEVTQQAASKAVAELAALGIVEIAAGRDRRAKIVRLSPEGVRIVQSGRHARLEIDRQLVKALGKTPYAATKTALLRCLEELGGIERIQTRRIRQPE